MNHTLCGALVSATVLVTGCNCGFNPVTDCLHRLRIRFGQRRDLDREGDPWLHASQRDLESGR